MIDARAIRRQLRDVPIAERRHLFLKLQRERYANVLSEIRFRTRANKKPIPALPAIARRIEQPVKPPRVLLPPPAPISSKLHLVPPVSPRRIAMRAAKKAYLDAFMSGDDAGQIKYAAELRKLVSQKDE